MGLFDTIYLHESIFPVVSELQERGIQLGSQDDLQTKDLECYMAEYHVGADRQLMLRKPEYKQVETTNSIFPFALEEVGHEMIHDNATCEAYCCYYRSGVKPEDEDIWVEFKVIIIRGVVDAVEVYNVNIESSAPRLAQIDQLRESILQREQDVVWHMRRKLAIMCGRIANFFSKIQYSLLRS